MMISASDARRHDEALRAEFEKDLERINGFLRIRHADSRVPRRELVKQLAEVRDRGLVRELLDKAVADGQREMGERLEAEQLARQRAEADSISSAREVATLQWEKYDLEVEGDTLRRENAELRARVSALKSDKRRLRAERNRLRKGAVEAIQASIQAKACSADGQLSRSPVKRAARPEVPLVKGQSDVGTGSGEAVQCASSSLNEADCSKAREATPHEEYAAATDSHEPLTVQGHVIRDVRIELEDIRWQLEEVQAVNRSLTADVRDPWDVHLPARVRKLTACADQGCSAKGRKVRRRSSAYLLAREQSRILAARREELEDALRDPEWVP